MKSVALSFDLERAEADDYVRAYDALYELGFAKIAQGISLPASSLIGTWWGDQPIAEIRDSIWAALVNADVRPARLLVCEFVDCAWLGPQIGRSTAGDASQTGAATGTNAKRSAE